MLFNSLVFAVFLPTVFAIYWILDKKASLRIQNFFILVVSYIFYGWWDWRFLVLIMFSSVIDFISALKIERSEVRETRKKWMSLSLVTNLGMLGFFKYFNFFIDSAADMLNMMGLHPNVWSLRIILPVGISFYTFQALRYTIDVYRRELKATPNIVDFLAFVSFFPQLVAGPIERAAALLPQFYVRRKFELDKARDGMRQMLWGFAKKLVVADNLAPHVQQIYNDPGKYDGFTLILGTIFFALQIYCDFSGYSDIAIGSAKLFGFKLMRNFAFPYFSRDIGEFWRRWHISLSTWFRDYVYIPLGGSHVSKARQLTNTMVTFTVSGFWHGANWTFIVWGFLNGLYLMPQMVRKNRVKQNSIVAAGRLWISPLEAVQVMVTFVLTLIAWVFFRSASVGSAVHYFSRVFQGPFFTPGAHVAYTSAIVFGVALLVVEWFQRERQHALEIQAWPMPVRWAVYQVVVLVILTQGNFGSTEFIYFQF